MKMTSVEKKLNRTIKSAVSKHKGDWGAAYEAAMDGIGDHGELIGAAYAGYVASRVTKEMNVFSLRYAEICASLRELFDSRGLTTPMILDEENGVLTAYRVDELGHLHRVHRDLSWDEADFIEDGSSPTPPPKFV